MKPWTKLLAPPAAALLWTSLSLTSTNVRADEPNDPNDNDITTPDDAEVTRDLERGPYYLDRDWYRRYGRCYSYCDNLRDTCVRRYFRGFDHRSLGNRHRWDWHDAQRVCQRRFDICIDACRDARWNDYNREVVP